MWNEDRAPSQEENKQCEFPKQRLVWFIKDLFKDFTLALAQLFSLLKKRQRGEIFGDNRVASLLIFDHPRSGNKIVQCLLIWKSIEDFAPDPKIEAGKRDDVDQKKRNNDCKHEADLKRLVYEKMFSAILRHDFPQLKS